MNINHHICKIESASYIGGFFTFNISGCSKYFAEYALVSFNGVIFKCNLIPIQSVLPYFVPNDRKVFVWKIKFEVHEKSVNLFENTFELMVNEQKYHVINWYNNTPSNIKIPEILNIHRVTGNRSNEVTYRNDGRSEYLRCRELISAHMGSDRKLSVLDWGIGCARVAQHFMADERFMVEGIDVDHVNLGWCRSNLKNLSVYSVPFYPSTGIALDKYDVVMSLSVFSHLTPELWAKWLSELSKCILPDGIGLISFCGDHSASVILSKHVDLMGQLSQKGYYDSGPNHDLGESFSGLYRNVFYSDRCAKRLLEENFAIIDFVPGIFAGHETCAVVKKK
jgi:2-polyprenyl-3-methyl-5-hydroxy-6-metoxy-1,4-benzoquinol methylase